MKQPSAAARALLLLTCLLAWGGLLLQLWLSGARSLGEGHGALAGVLQALCYFTILSNLLVALVSSAWLLRARTLLQHPGILAATAVYIFVVGVIYALLLRATWAPTGLQKVADVLLHDVVPLLYVLWWLVGAPAVSLPWSAALWWLVYPLAYFGASVVGGVLTGRYLYPFVDVGSLGAATVARNAMLLLLLFWLLGLAALAFTRWRSRRARAVVFSPRARNR
jgi:hypothetical protein